MHDLSTFDVVLVSSACHNNSFIRCIAFSQNVYLIFFFRVAAVAVSLIDEVLNIEISNASGTRCLFTLSRMFFLFVR